MIHPARRFRLDLGYDGTDFAGWQLQPHQRTVQGELETVLSCIQGSGTVRVRGAGRTDAGAHARGQVADFLLATRLDEDGILRALSKMLPADVRPHRVRAVAPSFHSWRHAIEKTYRYRLDRTAHGDPFLARYALHFPFPIDHVRLGEVLHALPGKRDWSGFAASKCEKEDRVRHVFRAEYVRAADETGSFLFAADGFLTHMVRNLVGTLLEIVQGRLDRGTIAAMLATGDRGLGGPTAPARGLCLESVRYPAEPARDESDLSPL